MIEFVPLEYYTAVYLNGTFAIVLFTLLHTFLLPINDSRNIAYIKFIGYLLLAIIVVYLGLRPISFKYFVDMSTYAKHFEYYANGGSIVTTKDVFFHVFMKITSTFLSVNNFFLLCSFLYIFPMYKVSKSFFSDYWFYAFLILISSFQFWAYGVNGIRNGIATSFFLMAVAYNNKKIWMAIFLVFAVLFHKSLLLPILALGLTFLYNKPKIYLLIWLAAIPLSLGLGSIWETIFASMGFAEDRLGSYLTGESASGAFRFDFLLYSASAVFTGWYYIYKRNFNDKLYFHLFNTYLITNAFWILIIRANFSNRFAYLSWFIIGIIIIYPFLKERFYVNQHAVIGTVVALYFGFTYFMYTLTF